MEKLIHVKPASMVATIVVWMIQSLFLMYLALSALDVGRALAVAALNYSVSARFTLIGMSRDKGDAYVFDTVEGRVVVQPLPERML